MMHGQKNIKVFTKYGQIFNQLRNYYRLKNDPTTWLGSGAEVHSVYAYVFLTVWNGLATLNFLTSLLKEPNAMQRSSSPAHQIWSALVQNRNAWQKVLNQKERKEFFCVSVCPCQPFKKPKSLTKFAMHVVPMVTTVNWEVAN